MAPGEFHVSRVTCHVSCDMFRVSRVCHESCVMCHVCVMSHVSCVMCHVLCVMCHETCVMRHVWGPLMELIPGAELGPWQRDSHGHTPKVNSLAK